MALLHIYSKNEHGSTLSFCDSLQVFRESGQRIYKCNNKHLLIDIVFTFINNYKCRRVLHLLIHYPAIEFLGQNSCFQQPYPPN